MSVAAEARRLREMIETAIQFVDDRAALGFVALHPAWSPKKAEYAAGLRLRYRDRLYRVLQDHESQEAWNPEEATTLFEPVRLEEKASDEAEQTGPYMMGDRAVFDGKTYASLIDNNIWTYEEYPQGWIEVV